MHHLKAYDLLIQAESGLSFITGNPQGMARVGISIADITAGMTACQAVLQALLARNKNGQGRHIKVSLFHALADWMNVPYLQFVYGQKPPERGGLTHPTIAPYGAYTVNDGKQVLLAIQNEPEWTNFCMGVLQQAELANDIRFTNNLLHVANRIALDEIIDEVFAPLSRDEIIRRLEAAKIAYGRISTLHDLAEHPQNRYVTVDTPNGEVRMLAPGAFINGDVNQLGAVPALGQHTENILAEFSGNNST